MMLAIAQSLQGQMHVSGQIVVRANASIICSLYSGLSAPQFQCKPGASPSIGSLLRFVDDLLNKS